MYKFLAVFIGGGFGAMLRYYIGGTALGRFGNFFPLGTLLVNVLGSFVLGFGFAYFLEHVSVPDELKLLLTVGFCGGLTTFSTFALDIWNLFLDGEVIKGTLYIILNVVLSVAAIAGGVLVAKQFS